VAESAAGRNKGKDRGRVIQLGFDVTDRENQLTLNALALLPAKLSCGKTCPDAFIQPSPT